MNDNTPFLELAWPFDEAVGWLLIRLRQAGMRVIRTFDLQSARTASAGCPCPYHGTAQCDCQMVVLLIYQGERGPVSIVAHGHARQTWFMLVDNAQQPADPFLVKSLKQTAVGTIPAFFYQENQARPI